MNIYKNTNVMSGFIWRLMERTGARIVSFVVSVVLARILDPESYGTVALITVFTAIMQVFVDSGLGNALIQKKEVDDIDYSTVFWTNLSFCVVLYSAMWILAPTIADFYKDDLLIPLVRVLSLTIVISGVKNIQQAYISRNMQFRKFFFATLGGTIGAAIIGISMALKGFGIWALVAQQVFNLAIDTLILWIAVSWRPKFIFSFNKLRSLFSYGWKLLASSLLDTGYHSLRQLLIGRIYSKADLAYYNQGDKFPALIINNINSSIDSVLLPAMSHEQDDRKRVRSMTRRAITIGTYLISPMLIGMAACADGLIRIVLTDKWIFSVPYLRIFCIGYIFYPIHTANLNAIKAMGRSDIFLKLEVIKKAVGVIILIFAVRISVAAIAWSLLVANAVSLIVNSWPNRKLLQYSLADQVADIFENTVLAIIMGIVVFAEGFFLKSGLFRLGVQVISGAGIYLAMSVIFKNPSYVYLVEIIKRRTKRTHYEKNS